MLDATERKALTLSAFAASCLAFAPGQIVSGLFLLLVAYLLWQWDQRVLRREAAAREREAGPAATPEAAPQAAEPEA